MEIKDFLFIIDFSPRFTGRYNRENKIAPREGIREAEFSSVAAESLVPKAASKLLPWQKIHTH